MLAIAIDAVERSFHDSDYAYSSMLSGSIRNLVGIYDSWLSFSPPPSSPLVQASSPSDESLSTSSTCTAPRRALNLKQLQERRAARQKLLKQRALTSQALKRVSVLEEPDPSSRKRQRVTDWIDQNLDNEEAMMSPSNSD